MGIIEQVSEAVSRWRGAPYLIAFCVARQEEKESYALYSS